MTSTYLPLPSAVTGPPDVPDIPDATGEPRPHSERRSVRRERTLLGLLLSATALLYLWGLGASGYANEFYAAAVQSGTKSWKAFFFGSFDISNSITVDKPPAALWPMELSGRIFGFNSWSMLVPQAIEGVLAVWLLYAIVRRWFGPNAGLLAGGLLALTPVAVLMFRFNNPDALMTLLIVAAAYCVTRAIDSASTRWLLLAGLAMGFSFLAKGLQPFTVLPALALAYLMAAPTSLRRRLFQLLGAGAALLAGAGWWVLAVSLTPASARPYIGGSGDNTALGLALGYNGLSRITGGSGGPGGGGGGANFSGAAGIGRLFNSLNGGQVAWLLPTALVAIAALAAVTWRLPRTDRTRAALVLWGGWLLVTGAVLSYASGIIHTYYTVELAPAIAALVAIGAVTLWRQRDQLWARLTLAGAVLATGFWSATLLSRTSGWNAWLTTLVAVATGLAVLGLLVPAQRWTAQLRVVGALAAVVAIGAGPAGYALSTAATVHTGSVPSAGPTTAGGMGGPGGMGGGMTGPGGGTLPSGASMPNGASPPNGASLPSGGSAGGATGGGRSSSSVDSALVTLLKSTDTTWAAATVGSQEAAPLQLASGKAIMAIGGFSGTDAAPTLAQFKQYVAAGKVRYFIAGASGGGGGAMGGGSGSGSAITSWVESTFASTTVGSTTVYDLTKTAA